MRRTATLAALALALAAFGIAHAAGKGKQPRKHGNHSMHIFMGGDSGQLGVQVSSMTDELRAYFGAPAGQGILVGRVEANTPAALAGVKVGDVIISVDGDAVDAPWDVWRALSGHARGDRVEVVVVRDKRRKKLSATLDKDAVSFAMPGMKFGSGGNLSLDLDDLGSGAGRWFGGVDDDRVDRLEDTIERLERKIDKLERKLSK